MRRLKEQVKAGEIVAAEALRILEAVAQSKGESEYLKTTKTYRWLMRRKEGSNAKKPL